MEIELKKYNSKEEYIFDKGFKDKEILEVFDLDRRTIYNKLLSVYVTEFIIKNDRLILLDSSYYKKISKRVLTDDEKEKLKDFKFLIDKKQVYEKYINGDYREFVNINFPLNSITKLIMKYSDKINEFYFSKIEKVKDEKLLWEYSKKYKDKLRELLDKGNDEIKTLKDLENYVLNTLNEFIQKQEEEKKKEEEEQKKTEEERNEELKKIMKKENIIITEQNKEVVISFKDNNLIINLNELTNEKRSFKFEVDLKSGKLDIHYLIDKIKGYFRIQDTKQNIFKKIINLNFKFKEIFNNKEVTLLDVKHKDNDLIINNLKINNSKKQYIINKITRYGYQLNKDNNFLTDDKLKRYNKLSGVKVEVLGLNKIEVIDYIFNINIEMINDNLYNINIGGKDFKVEWNIIKKYLTNNRSDVYNYLSKDKFIKFLTSFINDKKFIEDYIAKVKMMNKLKQTTQTK